MRKKLPASEKRSKIIGIKVKEDTHEKLAYIASLEGNTLSTYINKVLNENIEQFFEERKIVWEDIPPEEKENRR